MPDAALAARLREAREYLGFTVEQAAARAGMTVFTLQLLETGGYTPAKRTMKRLAAAYLRPVDWFSGDWEWTPSPELLRRVEHLSEGDREAMLDFAEFLQGAGPAPELTRKREVPGG